MERVNRFLRELSEAQWLERQAVRGWTIDRKTYVLPGRYEELGRYEVRGLTDEGDVRELGTVPFPSKQGTTYFFRTKLDIPAEWDPARGAIGLLFESGGEGLLRVNGASWQGLDRNHTFAALDASQVGFSPELEIELFDPIPEPNDPLNRQAVIQPPISGVRSELAQANGAAQSLLYAATIVRDSAALLPETDFRRQRLFEALYRAMDAFVGLTREEIREGSVLSRIEERLAADVGAVGGNAEGTIRMVGQSHIDIAWLWPVRETVRKTSRTFSTVDALMREYPDFKYAQSQPILFEFLKNNDPELYGRVKARIAEGRWELVGGMWVEPDLNIPSGESLMRQMLYGQRFYREEFGLVSRIEWLPDTFGYCASLPQILKHGGISCFMTTKLGWNDTNVFPYDLFHWVGIDGTPILSYLNHGVNEHTLPKDVHDHWQSYRQKSVHPEQMLLYGHGDGGGGVTREMLESIGRSELMVGQPASRYGTAADFFAGVEGSRDKLPSWHGDLYLELHRGTYTTHGRNKRSNRKAELLYREAELWLSLALPDLSAESERELRGRLHEGWKLILLNQFHDIIPGSAISEAYRTSEKEYGEIEEHGRASLNAVLPLLAERIDASAAEGAPYVVFNGLGWKRDVLAELEGAAGVVGEGAVAAFDSEGRRLPCDATEEGGLAVLVPGVPAFGYRTIWLRGEDGAAASGAAAAGTGAARSAGVEGMAGLKGSADLKDSASSNGSAGPARSAGDSGNGAGLPAAGDEELPGAGQPLGDRWETPAYSARFNGRGEIVSLFDKEANREIVKPGEAANRFHFYYDRPTLWDAWDIDDRYESQRAGEAELLEKGVVLRGETMDVLRFRWRLHRSEIRQDILFYKHDKRIDFRTSVSWNEDNKLLKVGFPIDVVASKATFEIPFGALERPTHRNTSWEQAQFEVCGHRFADVSEYGYGVSLLNDCKYGYDVQGTTLRLSLLRAPKWPDDTADLGEHRFTYSLYPHEGDWRAARTVRRAAELNADAIARKALPGRGELPADGVLLPFESEHVVLDTVKPAEDGDGIVLRLYESSGGRGRAALTWPRPFEGAFVSNALEEELEPLSPEGGRIELVFAPFEIKTVKIKGR
ncbi:alpha-mannosidase [Cohnella xylanilytica]|uniref:alpha-mannosidase n=1 Tax=Cohnella xylanilytica TaxID=557555 RepID=A0A841U110_9BACL|nr:glycoside hydrolase family 38 C-terminal domain-containing protein [Cohnella xylanilytica]MBB6694216.1 alpha-mannosidase [Cohnella xylanilytica]